MCFQDLITSTYLPTTIMHKSKTSTLDWNSVADPRIPFLSSLQTPAHFILGRKKEIPSSVKEDIEQFLDFP